MKYLFGVIAGLILSTGSALAADFSISKFHADITVNTNSSISVVETIDVNFPSKRHGIFRYIPYLIDTRSDMDVPYYQYAMPITVNSVTDRSGAAIPFEVAQAARDLIIRIGDPNRKIRGDQQYVISYQAEAAATFYPDHDELYWNVTGVGWEVAIPNSSATIHLPETFSGAGLNTLCYTGEYGSTAQDCTASVAGRDVMFGANDFLTVAVSMPVGTITKPANYEFTRQNTDVTLASAYDDSFLEGSPIDLTLFTPLKIGLNLLVLLVAGLGIFWWWWKHGRDAGDRRTIIAEYEPPNGLRPAEVGVIYDERAQTQDITATIIDLAVQGILTIEEIEEKKLLGLSKKKDYVLRLTKTATERVPKLQPFEQDMISGLFDGKNEVKLSDLKNEFYTSIPGIQSKLYSSLTRQGYFAKNPNAVRNVWMVVGLVVIGLGFVVAFSVGFFVVPLLGVMLVILARTLPKRTAKGTATFQHIQGFREFLHTAERYRLQWQEKEKIFETFLPYAMVLGVAKQWANTFKDVAMEPPSWYTGSSLAHFNSVALFSGINSLASTSASTLTSHPSSSGSGLSGGGFSGGGGGGGGGGSW